MLKFFEKGETDIWPWLWHGLDFGTTEKVLIKGIYIWNIWKLYQLALKYGLR